MPIKKMMPPGTTIWWVDIAHAATAEDCLKVGLYGTGANKAVDISCAVVSGFTLNPTDSETDSSTSICDSAAVSTPVRDTYEASLPFFREAFKDDAGGMEDDSPATKVFNLFKHGGVSANKVGWLVKRIGYPNTTPAKAGQPVSVFKVMPDNPQDEVGEGTVPIQMTVPFLPQGSMLINKPLVD